jgi:hypothetical protein
MCRCKADRTALHKTIRMMFSFYLLRASSVRTDAPAIARITLMPTARNDVAGAQRSPAGEKSLRTQRDSAISGWPEPRESSVAPCKVRHGSTAKTMCARYMDGASNSLTTTLRCEPASNR